MAAGADTSNWSLALEASDAVILFSSVTGDTVLVAWETEAVLKHESVIAGVALVLCLSGTASTANVAGNDLL